VIARLTGIIDSIGEDHAVIDVAGVGYLVFCSSRTLRNLVVGKSASLPTETHVREDHIHLYGFADNVEREWFRLLTTVQGVGAKLALSILSALEPKALADAIASEDRASVTRAPGVGPKLATRILAELKDKAGAAEIVRPAFANAARGAAEDAISALVNLGYRRGEAFGAVNHAVQRLGAEAQVEALITAGLKELSA
jgi:Holliday junction DNA helicase RuvA